MKTLTRDAVAKIARALITLNGKTTTLEVKTALRKLGYFAIQSEVRYFMLDITSVDGDITYEENLDDGYRTYSFKSTSPLALVYDSHEFVVKNGNLSVCARCGRSEWAAKSFGWKCEPTQVVSTPPAPKKIHRDDVRADYEVTDPSGWYLRTYSQVCRSKAKQRWSLDTGFPYHMARTKKIS